MTREHQPVATGLAFLLAFFVMLFLGGMVGAAVVAGHRGALFGLAGVALVGMIVFGALTRRSWLARRGA